MQFDDLSYSIIGCALNVHRALGPGLLESSYKCCLCHELTKQGYSHDCEVPMPLIYDNQKLDCGYRIDILVQNKIIIEIKSVQKIEPIFFAQVITYLKLSNKSTGLLINFNVKKLKEGIHRINRNI